MVRHLINDLLTAEEKAALKEDLIQLFLDTETAITCTYHVEGSNAWDKETGAVTETSGASYTSVPAFQITPRRDEIETMHVMKAEEVIIILDEWVDAYSITPKIQDQIVVGSVTKYVKGFVNAVPGVLWRFYVSDKGN